MNWSIARKGLIGLLILSLISSPVAATAAASGGLNWSSDLTPDIYPYEKKISIAEHNGTEMNSPLQYYNDNGEVTKLDAKLNESIDNSVQYRADKVSATILKKFPRESTDASAIDATEWTVGGQNSSKASATNVQIDGNVQAVELKTDGTMGSGDVATFTYSNFSALNDGAKRVALQVGQINTLDAGAHVTVNYTDSDGDVKSVIIDPDANASDVDVAATSTANGYIYQAKMSELPTKGSGDGDFTSITSVKVKIQDADAELTLNGLDAERKSKMPFGEHLANTDSDDELETVTTYQNADGGLIDLSSMSTLPSEFDSATLYDLKVKGLMYSPSQLASGDVYVNFSSADNYPNFPTKLEVNYRLNVPAAIDLSHSGLSLRAEQSYVSERYLTYQYAEGTGDKEPSEVSSWTDASGALSDKGATLTLDSTVQPGQNIMANAIIKITDSEESELKQQGGSGTGPQGSSGGLVEWLMGLPGLIAAAVLGMLGLRSRGA